MEQTNNNMNSQKKIPQYKHLSHSERMKIQKLYNEGYSFTKIGKLVSRDKNTISLELRNYSKRNLPSSSNIRQGIKEFHYNANKAQKLRNQKYLRPRFHKKFEPFIKFFNKNIKPYKSIEEVWFEFRNTMSPLAYPSLRTLYNWAYKGIIKFPWGEKLVKTSRAKHSKVQVEDKKNISQREKDFGFDLKDYSQLGHYEIDTIYNGDKKGGILTFNERATRLVYARVIPDRRATTINKALRDIIGKIGHNFIQSITSDNGSEFAYSAVIEHCYDLKWYYCDPYSSWQRGQNERINRDFRKFYPKGSLITRISHAKFNNVVHYINNKPRRIFSGLSAYDYSFKLKYRYNK